MSDEWQIGIWFDGKLRKKDGKYLCYVQAVPPDSYHRIMYGTRQQFIWVPNITDTRVQGMRKCRLMVPPKYVCSGEWLPDYIWGYLHALQLLPTYGAIPHVGARHMFDTVVIVRFTPEERDKLSRGEAI